MCELIVAGGVIGREDSPYEGGAMFASPSGANRSPLPERRLMVQSSDENEALWVALKRGAESDPWWNLLGVTVEQITRGSCRLRLHLADATRRSPAATVREGVLACLMEAAVCTAIDSLDIPGMRGRTAVSLSMSILTPASQDVVAEARVIQAGPEGATGEAELRDASGALVAKGIVVCAASLD